MTVFSYIKDKLTKLSESIKDIQLVYGYDKDASIHIIEVDPIAIYDDDIFIHSEKEILDEILELYPKESIAFIKKGDIPGIENELFRISGDNYSDFSFFNLVKPEYQSMTCYSVIKEYPVSFNMTPNITEHKLIKNETVPIEAPRAVQIDLNSGYSVDFSFHYSPLAA